eukprot:3279023-Pyramimonas_sp.AAC.1
MPQPPDPVFGAPDTPAIPPYGVTLATYTELGSRSWSGDARSGAVSSFSGPGRPVEDVAIGPTVLH